MQLWITEWMKIRRSWLPFLLIIGPVAGILIGISNFLANQEVFIKGPDSNEWLEAWTQVQLFYASIIFPVLVSIMSAIVCRSEHISGGWKQLLALPVSRSSVYLTKLMVVAVLIALMQVMLLSAYIAVGSMLFHSTLPIQQMLRFIILGWLAALPLSAMQMIVSVRFISFGLPLAINIACTLPVVIVVNSTAGQYYPWALPALAMSPEDESPIQSYPLFYAIVIGVLLISVLIGVRSFEHKDSVG
ncbi:ABC transporter permease [Paenibacillus donghaensis]|nr:ABC transporter permease [Paenibacillus donghaensis]